MKVNVGGSDRLLRVIAGLALIGLTLMRTIGAWGCIGLFCLLQGYLAFAQLMAC